MKHLFIYSFLFLLVFALASFLDLLQGIGMTEALNNFINIKNKLTSDDLFLLFLFFLPLIISKVQSFHKRKHLSDTTSVD